MVVGFHNLLKTNKLTGWGVNLLSSEDETTEDPNAGADATEDALPTPLASYDFGEESADVTFKHLGAATAPYSVPLSETEKGLQFTEGGSVNDLGYIQVANPFEDNEDIESAGVTVSLWVYRDNGNAKALFGFGMGLEQYEDYNNSGSFGLQTDGYMPYNMKAVANADEWIDFNRLNNSVPIPEKTMSMVTMTIASTGVTLYVNGTQADWGPGNHGGGELTDLYPKMLNRLKDHFTHFYVGKGGFQGTFAGKADKLNFYAKALTAEEVQALYDEQKVGLVQDIADVTTEYVENADFSDGTNGWNTGGAPIDANILETNGIPFVSINQWSYGKTFDCTQTLTDLPIGLYRLSAQVSSSTGNSEVLHLTSSMGDSRVGFGNSGMAVADAATKWAQDKEANRVYTGNVLVIDGTATIGMNRNNQRNGEVYFDNFRLEKVGDGFIELADMYANLKNEAQAIEQDALASELKTKLETALAATPSTSEEYVSAYTALDAVVDLCNTYISECPIETLIETCEGYSQNSVSTSATKATFDAAIAAAEAVDLSTVDINGLREAYNALEAARQAFAQNAVPTGEQEFDITFMLTNPEVGAYTSASRVPVPGWSGDNPENLKEWAIQAMNNGNQKGETQWNSFFECYAAVDFVPCWLIYQTVNIPAGSYRMESAAFAAPVNNIDQTTIAKAALYAGDTRGDAVESTTLKYYSVAFETETAGEIRLGMKIEEGNQINWAGMNDMHLYKVAPEAVDLTLDEANAYGVTADTYANVTMTRAMSAKLDGEETAKWNTFCVPFDMTAQQLADNKITKVVQLTGAETTVEGGINLTSTDVTADGVKAGVPYLVQVSEDVTEITAEGVYVTAAAPAAQTIGTAGDYTVAITGNYSAQTVPTDAYFISDNMFYVADAEAAVSLKGFRAYVTLTDAAGEVAQANVRSISIDGNTEGDGTTAIEGVSGETADRLVDVYTLSGVKVKGGVKASEALDGLQRGIYIVGGKKVVK